MWTGKKGSESQGHVGLQVIGGWKNLWGRSIPQIPGDGFPNSTNKHRDEPDSEPPRSDDSGPAPRVGNAPDVSQRDAKQEQTVRYVSFLPRPGLLHRMLREPRLKLQLPVRVCGMSATGRAFIENAIAENVSRNGARLVGLTCEVRKDEVLILSHEGRSGRFRTIWSEEDGARPIFQIGLRAFALAHSIWAIDFSGVIMDECEPVERRVAAQRYLCSGAASIWHPEPRICCAALWLTSVWMGVMSKR